MTLLQCTVHSCAWDLLVTSVDGTAGVLPGCQQELIIPDSEESPTRISDPAKPAPGLAQMAQALQAVPLSQQPSATASTRVLQTHAEQSSSDPLIVGASTSAHLFQHDGPTLHGVNGLPAAAGAQQRQVQQEQSSCCLKALPLHAASQRFETTESPAQQALTQYCMQEAQPILALWSSSPGQPLQRGLQGHSELPSANAVEPRVQPGGTTPGLQQQQLQPDAHLLRPQGPTEDNEGAVALPSSHARLKISPDAGLKCTGHGGSGAIAEGSPSHDIAAPDGMAAQLAQQHGQEGHCAQIAKVSQPSSSSLKRVPETPDSAEHRSQPALSPGMLCKKPLILSGCSTQFVSCTNLLAGNDVMDLGCIDLQDFLPTDWKRRD